MARAPSARRLIHHHKEVAILLGARRRRVRRCKHNEAKSPVYVSMESLFRIQSPYALSRYSNGCAFYLICFLKEQSDLGVRIANQTESEVGSMFYKAHLVLSKGMSPESLRDVELTASSAKRKANQFAFGIKG